MLKISFVAPCILLTDKIYHDKFHCEGHYYSGYSLLYTRLSYKEFMEKNPNYKACKFIGNNFDGFEYKLGVNTDHKKFNPTTHEGGLHFTDFSDIFDYEDYGDNIAMIELFDNEPIYLRRCEYKTPKFKITKIMTKSEFINSLNENELKMFAKKYPRFIKLIPNPTEYFYKLVVQQNGLALKYIKTQTDDICKLAVQQNGLALEHVKTQTDDICKLAIQQTPFAYGHVLNKTEELYDLAVKQNSCIPDYYSRPFSIRSFAKKILVMMKV